MNKIFAFVGMCGSGKSIGCDVLKEMGWNYIRFGQITIDSLKEEGKAVTPENEKIMREALRKNYGMGAFALLSSPKIDAALKQGNVVIDGLYSWSEYKILMEKFGSFLTIICIHASPRTRYTRLEQRHILSEDTDVRMRPLTRDQARARDYAEIENIEKGGPIAMADIMIVNESSEEELKQKIKELADETGKNL
ncbi:MAG: AAA family ATPase [Spirochaetales bacterium]|nr:AAA family ATPase [Spirochaetales bacterium]